MLNLRIAITTFGDEAKELVCCLATFPGGYKLRLNIPQEKLETGHSDHFARFFRELNGLLWLYESVGAL